MLSSNAKDSTVCSLQNVIWNDKKKIKSRFTELSYEQVAGVVSLFP